MTHDGHIRLLPLHVANKIAAGEVVERPASVLKELMENALDAGATRIDVTVTAGGRTLVSVRDNGHGMTRDDALLSLERQATSKIRDVDDIERIETLGFRGEAIPSIAAVSRFTLVTRRPQDESGTRLTVNAGQFAEVVDCGAPPGTCVEVRDLFCNVPARRKFLRAFATDEAHIRTTFTIHALAHPDVGFSLTLDGRETYRFAPGATLEERVRDLFGAPFTESLLCVTPPETPVRQRGSDVAIHGYLQRPDRDGTLRHDQFIFVNGRPATSSAIAYALREGYPRQRAESRPAVILFITLPPNQVDVNVHPAKREVRFRRPADVREALIAAIQNTLLNKAPSQTSLPSLSAGLRPVISDEAGPSAVPPPPSGPADAPFIPPFSSAPRLGTPPLPVIPNVSAPTSFKTDTPFSTLPPPSEERASSPVETPPSAGVVPAPPAATSSPVPLWRWFSFLSETTSGFLLLETDAGIVTLNPVAARERIVFERMMARLSIASQALLIPETVHLPPAAAARLRTCRAELEAIGFSLDEFGPDVWKVDAVPSLLTDLPVADLLATIAGDIAEAGTKRGGERWREEIIAKSVARSYAGASRKLTREGAIKLVEELAATRQPYVCPRGKPIMIFTSNRELNRKFNR